jgi:hypothetical protein
MEAPSPAPVSGTTVPLLPRLTGVTTQLGVNMRSIIDELKTTRMKLEECKEERQTFWQNWQREKDRGGNMAQRQAEESTAAAVAAGTLTREDLDEQAMLAQMDKRERKRWRRRQALTPGTSEFAARKSRSGTLSTKFVKNLLTPGTPEFSARDSRGGPGFSGKRIDASDGQPYDFASFQKVYGPQAEEFWSIAEPTAQGKKTKRKGKNPKGKTVKAKAKELIRTRRRRKKKSD